MKCASISLLFISLVATVSAQSSGKCLDLETKCVLNDGEGTDCRQIKQQAAAADGKCDKRLRVITVAARWCNNTGKRVSITSESALKFTGPAIAPKPFVLPVPTTSLANGECDEETWTTTIDTCEPFFNYELNVKTQNRDCRGYYFGRQMKSNCKVEGNIECFLEDKTPCDEYNGPQLIASQSVNDCPEVICIDATPESCRQDIRYKFTVRNTNKPQESILFDVKQPRIANSKIAWKLVEPNKKHFARLEGGVARSWNEVKRDVNVCQVIPSASINMRGNIVEPGTNNKDPDFKFCYNFEVQKVRRFGRDENGNKFPFCSDIGEIPCPNGHKGCTCPGVIAGSASDLRDEL